MSSGKVGKCHNIVQGEQIMLLLLNKALNQKSKTIKFEILLHCACTALARAWVLTSFKKSELHTYTHTHKHTHTHTQTHTHTNTHTHKPDYRMSLAHVY